MKTAILLREHMDFFKELDPFCFLDRAVFPDKICIGTVLTGADDGYDLPVGLMILKAKVKSVTVEWIYVRPEYRMQHIGTMLMNYAFRMAEGSGCDALRLYRTFNEGRKEICCHENAFLSEYAFEPEIELGGEWTAEVGSLLWHPVIGEGADKLVRTQPLRQLDDDGKSALRALLSPEKEGAFLYNFRFFFSLSDEDVSRVIVKNGKVTAAIFVQLGEEALYVTGLYGKSRLENMALLHGALMAARDKYGPSQKICVIKYNNSFRGMLKALFGESYVRNVIYTSSVAEHNSKALSFKRVEDFEQIYCILRYTAICSHPFLLRYLWQFFNLSYCRH